MSRGRDIHAKAEQAREGKQDFLESLKLTDEATVVYSEEGDMHGMSEVQGTRFHAFRHLFESTNNPMYLILALHASLSAVEIAEKSGIKEALAIPYRDLGKAYEDLENYQNAVELYQKSLDAMAANPPSMHDRPAVRSDIKAHLAFAKYMAGDKQEALSLMQEAISELESNTDEYKNNRDVWLSGAHMRSAEMLANDDPDKAKAHLQKAKEVIGTNKDLVLRKNQLEALISKLAS